MCFDDDEDDLDPVGIGDVYRFQVYVTDRNGNPIAIENAVFDFGYGVSPDRCDRENAGKRSATPSIGSVSIAGVTYGAANIEIRPDETADLVNGVSYAWALRMTLNGDPDVVRSGTFTAVSYPL